MTNFADHAANLESELNHLRSKSEGDDEKIVLLKRQLETQSMETTKMVNDHAEELRKLRERCDEAVRNEKEISGILNTAASGIVMGLRKMKGDKTPPPSPSDTRPGVRGHAVDDERLPRIEPPLEPVQHPTLQQIPPEVSAFAPPRYRRPGVNDDVDDGMRQIVQRLR